MDPVFEHHSQGGLIDRRMPSMRDVVALLWCVCTERQTHVVVFEISGQRRRGAEAAGASSSAQRVEETKYRKSDGLDSESPRYREEYKTDEYNTEKDDYFEIRYACMRRERFGRINVVRPTIQFQMTPLSLHFQMFQRTKDYIIASKPGLAEHDSIAAARCYHELEQEAYGNHAFPMPRHRGEGGTDTSTIWGQFLLRVVFLIMINDSKHVYIPTSIISSRAAGQLPIKEIPWGYPTYTVLGPGGQDGTVGLKNISSINGVVELSKVHKWGFRQGEMAQRRARVPELMSLALLLLSDCDTLYSGQETWSFSSDLLYGSNFEDHHVTLKDKTWDKHFVNAIEAISIVEIRLVAGSNTSPIKAVAHLVIRLIKAHTFMPLSSLLILARDEKIRDDQSPMKRYFWSTIITGWPEFGTRAFKVGLDSASIEMAPSMTCVLVERATRREDERNLRGDVPVCHGV
ncbi:hypothetical protein ARMSODRAFT_980783 [Armillaria solidipes]|uniref:Uncharacterized protein n=1 Tax=Armillaria solidipes TaxID=1076256 RepID=A0A2H3AU84_9AGAR|nr:hypothetical protein ARMSODRAFT_980783 [Armillaria solidipes]